MPLFKKDFPVSNGDLLKSMMDKDHRYKPLLETASRHYKDIPGNTEKDVDTRNAEIRANVRQVLKLAERYKLTHSQTLKHYTMLLSVVSLMQESELPNISNDAFENNPNNTFTYLADECKLGAVETLKLFESFQKKGGDITTLMQSAEEVKSQIEQGAKAKNVLKKLTVQPVLSHASYEAVQTAQKEQGWKKL